MDSSLKQLLVHADGSDRCGPRLEAALRLAQAHGARVQALYAAAPSEIAVPADGLSMELAMRIQELDERRRARARAAFDRSLNVVHANASWGELDMAEALDGFIHQAWFADLVVLGQHEADRPQTNEVPADFVANVVAASGKPALVLPYAGNFARIGYQVVIAWKPSREAAHAVAASLPLLKRASEVHVLTWSPQPEAPDQQPGLDLGAYLSSHGVQAQWQWQGPERGPVGEMLLSRCADLQADLLVMGCYSHSRAREWLLGGTSHTMLASMTLPVLMAH
jgi:nucleotide-binding universal stress UspA family protein